MVFMMLFIFIINFISAIALAIGIQLSVENKNCKEEINNVKRNKMMLLSTYMISAILAIICFILSV